MNVVFLPCFFLVAVVIGDKSFAKPIRECLTVVAQDDSVKVVRMVFARCLLSEFLFWW